jgi:hypothetical protein
MSNSKSISIAGESPWVVAAWMAGGMLAAALLMLLHPADLMAAAGSGSGSGGTSATSNFKKKGTASLQDIGVPVFGATAMAGIVTGVFAKKFAMAFGMVLVACVGLAISLDPENSMKSVGSGIADLFKS